MEKTGDVLDDCREEWTGLAISDAGLPMPKAYSCDRSGLSSRRLTSGKSQQLGKKHRFAATVKLASSPYSIAPN
jgi:hypothetical protein